MTEFIKTVLKILHHNSYMHFDFTTPKGLKITPSDKGRFIAWSERALYRLFT